MSAWLWAGQQTVVCRLLVCLGAVPTSLLPVSTRHLFVWPSTCQSRFLCGLLLFILEDGPVVLVLDVVNLFLIRQKLSCKHLSSFYGFGVSRPPINDFLDSFSHISLCGEGQQKPCCSSRGGVHLRVGDRTLMLRWFLVSVVLSFMKDLL